MPPTVVTLLLALAAPPAGLDSLRPQGPGYGAATCAEAWKATGAPEQEASNCQAPLALTEEVTRLLTAAAAHCTRSSACVDGPGARIAVNDIRVCPNARRPEGWTVAVSYCFTRHPEGDTRSCGRSSDDCAWLRSSASAQSAELTFRTRGKRLHLELPARIPGMEGCTPLNARHDGRCYGDSPPFEPRPVPLP